MTITSCIFDLDGVIVDTAKHHYIAWRTIAHTLGFDFTEEQNETLKGISRYDSLTKLLEIGGISMPEDEKLTLCEKKNIIYLDLANQMDESDILPGVKAFLTELKSHNIAIALGSASKNAVGILEIIGLKSYFDAIVDGNSVKNSKPDPEVFLLGAQLLGTLPSQTIVFEDSQKGLEAAKAGGFISVGIGDPAILDMADLVIPGFAEYTVKSLFDQVSSHINHSQA